MTDETHRIVAVIIGQDENNVARVALGDSLEGKRIGSSGEGGGGHNTDKEGKKQ